MKKYIALALMTFAFPAFAAEEAPTPTTYSPEFCEFTTVFPGEPYNSRKCDGDDPSKCYDQITYTQVYELSSTVNFRVLCSPISEDVIKNYSGEIMEATLKAMTEGTVVKTFDTSFRETEDYKQAGLVGEGLTGKLPTIYIAQLWIGKQSALSVEAELIGAQNPAADQLFSDVLKSISHTGVKKAEEAKPAETEEETKKEELEASPATPVP
jgi:hypothetical protein